MFDKVKEQVEQATSRAEAFKAIEGCDEPFLLLEFFDGGQFSSGEVWIKDGSKLVGAAAATTGHTGHMGLFVLLSSQHSKFAVRQIEGADDEPLDIALKDLCSNEASVITSIKSILWPVSESSEATPPKVEEEPAKISEPETDAGPDAEAEEQVFETGTPVFAEEDDTAAARKAEIEAAAAASDSSEDSKDVPPLPLNEDDQAAAARKAEIEAAALASDKLEESAGDAAFPLILDRDDLAEQRLSAIEAAKTEQPVASLPYELPRSDKTLETMLFETQQKRTREEEIARQSDIDEARLAAAAVDAGLSPAESPNRSGQFNKLEIPEAPRQPTARETVTKLRTLSSTHTAVPVAAKPVKEFPKQYLFVGLGALFILPLVALVFNPDAALKNRPNDKVEDTAAIGDMLKQSLDFGSTRAAVQQDSQPLAVHNAPLPEEDMRDALPFRLPEMHSPFRPPPVVIPDSTPPAVVGGADAQAHEELPNPADEESMKTMHTGSWKAPANPAPPLSPQQENEVNQAIGQAANLTSLGRLDQAAAVYAAACVRFPTHYKLRLATAMAYIRLQQYSYAKKLANEGMQTAQTYSEYLVYLNLIKNIDEMVREANRGRR